MHLKLFQKDLFKKQQKQLVIWSVIKLLIKLQKFQKIEWKYQENSLKHIPMLT